MKMPYIYGDLKLALKLAWSGDDLISQENLFELQEILANLTLEVAQYNGTEADLAREFPFLYSMKGEN